jgi:hypothetical protein
MFPDNDTRYILHDSVAEAEIQGVHLTLIVMCNQK